MNTLSTMVQIDTELSKTNAAKFATEIIQLNEEGNIDTLTLLARIEFLSQVLETAKADLREKAIDELDLYGPEAKTGVVKSGVTFKHKETAVKYDFSHVQHWSLLKQEEDIATQSKKEFETLLKTLKTRTSIADPNTGEMIDVAPPVKSSKTTVEITLKK
jgi:hypothetical protein